MTITLCEITRDNWKECARMRVEPDQVRFVASNPFSLAQSKYEPECVPLAVYDDEQMVGFVMYRTEDYGLAKVWFIDRVMIGEGHQKKGYGRAAMTLLLERLRSQKGYNAILISFVPENSVAQKLYSSLGFKDTGEIEDGELVYRIGLTG
ncbi:MAG: GNAT family N-acetyltransferase [Anaerolineaceae bacterium]|nr:GNAT family N-acetyltransferase [Anaerolineaceae bacterium]